MDNTFIKIGEVVRKEDWSRSKYHPMSNVRNLTKKTKTKSDGEIFKPIEKIAIYEVHVDMNDNIVTIKKPEINPTEQLKIVKFTISSASGFVSYLCGSCVIKKKDILKQLSLEYFKNTYVDKYNTILTPDSFIYRFRNLLENNYNTIKDFISESINNEKIDEIALMVNITYQDKINEQEACAFVECIDEMDEMFLQSSCFQDKGYTFSDAFYSMFNYGKFETKGVRTMYDDSIPFFSKEDFLSLYYAKKIYDQKSYNIDSKAGYSISIFPNYDGLTMNDIEKFLFKGKDIFNFNTVCDEIDKFIKNRTEKNKKEQILIPILLKFDLYYRYKLGQAGTQNMLRLNAVRYSQLLEIKKRMNDAYKLIYSKDKIPERFLYSILFTIYQDYNKSSERYMTTIFKTFQNIYQEKYTVPQQAEFCLLDKTQFIARKGDKKLLNETWNKLFNIYKFLKTMENVNYVSELVKNSSYQLGVELATFESGWKRGRENLEKRIAQFTGNIERIVYTKQDIWNYYYDLVQRLTRNRVKFGDHNNLLFLLETINDNEFNKKEFMKGYFVKKCTYNYPKKENDEDKKVVVENNSDIL